MTYTVDVRGIYKSIYARDFVGVSTLRRISAARRFDAFGIAATVWLEPNLALGDEISCI